MSARRFSQRGFEAEKGMMAMAIKNEWTETVEAQRAALEIRAKMINELFEEKIYLQLILDCHNTQNAYQIREINRLRRVLETIHKETLAKTSPK